MTLKALIIDDEPLARVRLRGLLKESASPQVEVVGEAGDGGEAMAWLNRHDAIDLMLIDIQMPGMAGTELAALVRQRADPPSIVFVTAHAEHAVHAFELDAVDYLTKPVRRERLQAALERVAQRRPQAADDAVPVLVFSDRGRMHRVPLADVLYLKAELKYVTLRTAEHSYVLDDALSDLEQRLGDRFIRVHRNALVARDAVRTLERRALEADDGSEAWAVQVAPHGEWLAVSRRQLAAVREALADAKV